MSGRQYIFIVTYGRSGSTVLQRVLQSIPGFFIRGENSNTLFALYLAYRRAHEARFRHGKRPHGPAEPWYGAHEIDPETFGRNLAGLFEQDILQPPEDARVVGFKEIRFHEAGEELFEPFLDFICGVFPGARFIFNMRRWEAVSKSSWWATMEPDNVREIIEGADSLYKAYATKNPSCSLLMQYEDYAANTAGLKPLYDYLGEAFDEAIVADILGDRLKHATVVGQEPTESHRTIKG